MKLGVATVFKPCRSVNYTFVLLISNAPHAFSCWGILLIIPQILIVKPLTRWFLFVRLVKLSVATMCIVCHSANYMYVLLISSAPHVFNCWIIRLGIPPNRKH